MLDITLLGTGGTLPLKHRFLTSLVARCNGSSLLIDCGEGTQIALAKCGLSFKPIDVICITHFHADHISGLPGFLLTMGHHGRTEPVTIIGPVGLRYVISGLLTIAPELPYELRILECQTPDDVSATFGDAFVSAFKLEHTMPCFGYAINVPRAGKFNPDKAHSNHVPMKAWGILQKQEAVSIDGINYTRDMVLDAPRQGLRLIYATDTRPTNSIVSAGENADVMILEGMFADKEKLPRAIETKHMMFSEAAEIAKTSCARELILTHFSPALPDPKSGIQYAKDVFSNAVCGKDGLERRLTFIDMEI